MNRESRGVNGQFVTTWGRDIEKDLWIGTDRVLTTVVTCVCGKTATFRGFPSPKVNTDVGFCRPLRTDEWFCSINCAAIYRTEEFQGLISEVQKEADAQAGHAEELRRILSVLNPITQPGAIVVE